MYAERLLKLADFLDTLPKEKFDFGKVIQQDGKPPLEALAAGSERCGTVGCALGWCPAVFPNDWWWVGDSYSVYSVSLKGHEHSSFFSAEQFFDLSYSEACFLFAPDTNNNGLGFDALPTEVAAGIRRFVESH